jgi:hypothetical protein
VREETDLDAHHQAAHGGQPVDAANERIAVAPTLPPRRWETVQPPARQRLGAWHRIAKQARLSTRAASTRAPRRLTIHKSITPAHAIVGSAALEQTHRTRQTGDPRVVEGTRELWMATADAANSPPAGTSR